MTFTFQLAILTDGSTTFAAFIYEDNCMINNLQMLSVVGFNKGDRRHYNNINILDHVNWYRIDGKCTSASLISLKLFAA